MRLKSILSALPAVLYFLTIMWWVILLMPMLTFITLVADIPTIIESGFAAPSVPPPFIAIFGLFIGLSLSVPAFRKMYYKLPWLYPYVKIIYMDLVIVGVASMILNYGYQVQNPTRHNLFYILMLIQLVVCRLLMCVYLQKRKVNYIGEEIDG